MNHLRQTCQGIAHIVLHKKEDVTFTKVESLVSTERGAIGFGSTRN